MKVLKLFEHKKFVLVFILLLIIGILWLIGTYQALNPKEEIENNEITTSGIKIEVSNSWSRIGFKRATTQVYSGDRHLSTSPDDGGSLRAS